MNTGWPDFENDYLERAVGYVWTIFFCALAIYLIPHAIYVRTIAHQPYFDTLAVIVGFDLVVLRVCLYRLYAKHVEVTGTESIKFRSCLRDHRKLRTKHVLKFYRCVGARKDFILSYVASKAGIGVLFLRELGEQEVEQLSCLGIKVETKRVPWATWLLPHRALWLAFFAMVVFASLYFAGSVINGNTMESSLTLLSIKALGLYLTMFGITNVLGADIFAFLKTEQAIPRFLSRLLGLFEGGLEVAFGLIFLGVLF